MHTNAEKKVLRAKNRMTSDLHALVSDAEDLLRSTATYSGESVDAARVRFKDTLDQFKSRVSDAQSAATEKWHDADGYVHDNPWRVVGIAAAVGVVVGLLLHRR